MADGTTYFAGLDIGGTTVKTILVDERGETVGDMVEVRSHVKDGYDATFGQLESALDQLTAAIGVSRDRVGGVGMDVPAPSCDGVIWGRANLAEDWVGTNIRNRLSERLGGTPVYMTNDGNAAALGEYAVRKNTGALLLVAPGTGLGGGLVLPGGRAYEGVNGLALEVGHISSPFREDDGGLPGCSCGKNGCLEAWVSLVALRRRIGLELEKPEHAHHPLNDGSSLEEKAFRLRDFARQGDELAIFLFRQQAGILGYGIADLVRVFDPGLVVLGGGLAETEGFRDDYLAWVKEGFEERAWSMYSHSPIDPEVVTTRFEWAIGGDSAAALGVAFAAREMFR